MYEIKQFSANDKIEDYISLKDTAILRRTKRAALISFVDYFDRQRTNWFPLSQLRQFGDSKIIYCSRWIVKENQIKGVY